MGNKIDGPLVNHTLMVVHRHIHQIAGHDSNAPDAVLRMLGKNVKLAETGQKVHVQRNEAGQYGGRLIYDQSTVTDENGDQFVRVSLDARDAQQMPKAIQGMRKRHGLTPLSPEELTARVAEAVANAETLETPTF